MTTPLPSKVSSSRSSAVHGTGTRVVRAGRGGPSGIGHAFFSEERGGTAARVKGCGCMRARHGGATARCQEQLGEMADVDRKTINRIENGMYSPHLGFIRCGTVRARAGTTRNRTSALCHVRPRQVRC
ncbi:helix-turn-helix transcriptional regulator [[Actinomadura] parvosata]|uniref:helix-turn-helix transcriptional regulator n=1 Tax=[Actinomadura] parvosata TaxID=1955412 RepID=UPI00406C64C8